MLSQKLRWGSSRTKTGVILACSIVLLFLAFLDAPETILDSGKISLKVSWVSSLAALLQQGQISGRDFHYTYGLLSQVIAYLGTMFQGSGSPLVAYPYIIICLEATSIVLIALILFLVEPLGWIQTILVYLGVGILQLVDFASFRSLFMVLAAIVLHRAIFSKTLIRQFLWIIITGLICVTAQLASVDLGFLTLSSIILTGIFYVGCGLILSSRHKAHLPYRRIGGAFVGTILAIVFFNLLIDIVFKATSPTYTHLFDYQRYAIEIIRGYNTTMSSPWDLATLPTIGLFIIVIATMGIVLKDILVSPSKNDFLWLGVCAFSIIQLKSTLLRSDDIHIIRGTLPFIVLFLLSAHSWGENKLSAAAWCILFVVLFVIRANTSTFETQTLIKIVNGKLTPGSKLQAINSISSEIDVSIPQELSSQINSPALLNFPFENYIAISAHKDLIAPTVLAHNAHTLALQHKYIDDLNKHIPGVKIVYAIDGIGTHLIDGVQNITRLPIIFEDIYSNFKLEREISPDSGFYLLSANTERRSILTKKIDYQQLPWDNYHTDIQLSQPSSCALIRISLAIEYPFTSLIGRPTPLQLTFMQRGTLVYQTNLVALQTGQEFSTYIGTFPAKNFVSLLEGGKNIQGATWEKLVITPRPMGFLEVPPKSIGISNLECVILSR